VRSVAAAVVLLALVGVAGCGDEDGSDCSCVAGTYIRVASAPERPAERSERSAYSISEVVLSADGSARVTRDTSAAHPSTGTWRFESDSILLLSLENGEERFAGKEGCKLILYNEVELKSPEAVPLVPPHQYWPGPELRMVSSIPGPTAPSRPTKGEFRALTSDGLQYLVGKWEWDVARSFRLRGDKEPLTPGNLSNRSRVRLSLHAVASPGHAEGSLTVDVVPPGGEVLRDLLPVDLVREFRCKVQEDTGTGELILVCTPRSDTGSRSRRVYALQGDGDAGLLLRDHEYGDRASYVLRRCR